MMESMKISILYLGRLKMLKKHLIDCESDTETIQCLIPAVLIKHPVLGNILYDTGSTPLYSTEHSHIILDNYPVSEFVSIEQALAEKGLRPSDIDILILSHLHFDHAGGLKYFVGTKAIKNVFISEGDLKQAYFSVTTGAQGAYCRPLFDVEGIRFHAINQTYALSDDITLLMQKCHTPGVIGLNLKTKNHGTIIFTGDTIYMRESYEKQIPPGGYNTRNQQDFFMNLSMIKSMEKQYQATLLFGHDEEQIKQWSSLGWVD